jgi:hypothetical protein
MPTPTPNHKEQETADRAERIQAAITTLESKFARLCKRGKSLPRDVMWLVTKHEDNEQLTGTTSYRRRSRFFPLKISLLDTNI